MIIVCDPKEEFRSRVREILSDRGKLWPLEELSEVEHLLAGQVGGVTVVMGPDIAGNAAVGLAERLRISSPQTPVVIVTHRLTANYLQSALRAGVRDVLPHSFTGPQLIDAIDRAEAVVHQMMGGDLPAHQEAASPVGGKVISIFSSKGGCGKSFLASNLGVLLAQRTGDSVVLVDLDLESGDLAVMMQMVPDRTIYDAAVNIDRLDAETLKEYLTPYKMGAFLLAAPLEPDVADKVRPDAVKVIIEMLKSSFKYVVIDCPPSFAEHVLAAFDVSDEWVLVTSMDVPSIKNLKLSLRTLDLLGIERTRTRLVLNRADSRVGLGVAEVERSLGAKVGTLIPSSRDVPLSINRGVPLAFGIPKSPPVGAIAGLADSISGRTEQETVGLDIIGRSWFRKRA